MKYKIIIVVFLLILFLYAGHFVITYLNNNKTKESFIDDDIEHYEDSTPKTTPKVTTTETKYDLRILILDDIEKLNISDKEVKGKLMQTIFADDEFMKSLESKSTKRFELIQEKYNQLNKTDLPSQPPIPLNTTQEESSIPVKAVVSPGVKDKFTTDTPVSSKTDDTNKELVTKTEEALNHLQYVQNNLKDIQTYAKSVAKTISTPPVPSTTVPTAPKSTFREPNLPEPFIEGYENVTSYASLF